MLTIDDREILEHPDIPQLIGMDISIQRLEAGDYAFLNRNNEPVGIERSEIKNFIVKLNNGELENQLERCASMYSTVILLLEGVFDDVSGLIAFYKQTGEGYWRIRISPTTRYDRIMAVVSRLMELGIEIVWTPNFSCSMQTIKSIYNQRNKPEELSSLFKKTKVPNLPTKLTKNPAVPKLMCLAERMPEKVAIRLINKFGSLWNVIHAPDEELLEVEGVGEGLIRNLKKGLGIDV